MKKQDKQPLYKKLYDKEIDRLLAEIKATDNADIYSAESRLRLKRVIYYGVMGTERDRDCYSLDLAEARFAELDVMVHFIGCLTPAELMEIFPIDKTYDGSRYQTKDYFSTMEVMNKLDHNQQIHRSINPLELLWDYQNWDISFFLLELMNCISEVRKLQGEPSLIDEFIEDMGIDTYTLHTDSKGKQYFYNRNTGKTVAVQERKIRPFKVIKGNKH